MKKVFLTAVLGLGLVACNTEAINSLEQEIDNLQSSINFLTDQLESSVSDLQSSDNQIALDVADISGSLVELNNLIDATNTDLQTQVDVLSDELTSIEISVEANEAAIEAVDIPSIDDLATEEDLEDAIDLIEALQEDATELETSVASLTAELTELATDVAAIEPTKAVVSAWAPSFDAQIADFTQTATTTIAGIVIGEASEREIDVVAGTATSTTVVSTFDEEDLSLDYFDPTPALDASISQTTTTTLYKFFIDDVEVYEHTTSETSSWTLN